MVHVYPNLNSVHAISAHKYRRTTQDDYTFLRFAGQIVGKFMRSEL